MTAELQPTSRWVHVDINSYFATLLQQENPFLRNKPIGVVKDFGRTCLIAVSKEAKKKGIKTGCPLAEAKLLCPEIMAVPVNFEMCLSATIRLKKLFEALAPEVLIFSLDEAFINIGDCQLIYPRANG
jgi:DNA polymerase IV